MISIQRIIVDVPLGPFVDKDPVIINARSPLESIDDVIPDVHGKAAASRLPHYVNPVIAVRRGLERPPNAVPLCIALSNFLLEVYTSHVLVLIVLDPNPQSPNPNILE